MPSKATKTNVKSKGKAVVNAASPALEAVPPDWPAIKSFGHLEANVLLPQQIVTILSLFSSSLCKTYIAFLSTLPFTTTPVRPKRGEAVRFNDRFQVDDETFARRLWEDSGLKEFFEREENEGILGDGVKEKEVVGLNPNIRVYRYVPGQFFDKHYDDSNLVTLTQPSPLRCRTTWTLLIYLSGTQDGVKGGQTAFYLEKPYPKDEEGKDVIDIVVETERGTALLHKHGKDCLFHEGKEVKEGTKWILRSDLLVVV
ncbi:hypothetical protein BT69DRAFT_1268296 [Atractiella rhizophila]|nr:hypothetical protein BT69DRAFT_1268296 [Atractiella rhizophila]